MIEFTGRGILLDIEGTTSSISFVYDVMFPFVRRELGTFLRDNWDSDETQAACEMIAADAGYESLAAWPLDAAASHQQLICDEVIRLMDGDVKATGLKQLQGLIWRAGFESGEMHAHVYDDVPLALEAWNANGLDVRIYSSGSIAAQKLFFGHTIHGDLLNHFNGHYDTTTGPKKEAASYTAIANEYGVDPAELLFISDVVAELEAASQAGMQTLLSIRPGNPDPPAHSFRSVTSFGDISVG